MSSTVVVTVMAAFGLVSLYSMNATDLVLAAYSISALVGLFAYDNATYRARLDKDSKDHDYSNEISFYYRQSMFLFVPTLAVLGYGYYDYLSQNAK